MLTLAIRELSCCTIPPTQLQTVVADAAPISERAANRPAVAASPPTRARPDPLECDSLSVPVQASDAPIITDDETPWLTEYVLPRYISGACEQKAQAIVDSVFSNFLLVNLEVGGAGGGGALEQGPTPPHPVPSLDKYETCMWRCYPKSIPGTCWDPEKVCTIVAGGAAKRGSRGSLRSCWWKCRCRYLRCCCRTCSDGGL